MSVPEQELSRIEEIQPLLNETKKVQRQTRWIRSGIVILILFAIFCWGWSIYAHFRKFDVEQFGNEIAKRADSTWPLISEELNKLLSTILPVVQSSVEKELETAAPMISEKFNSEAKFLENNIKKEVEDTIKKFLTQEGRKPAINEIKATFPSLGTDEAIDKLTSSLQESFLVAAQQELLNMLVQYYDTILKFEGVFNRMKADMPAGGTKPATFEGVLSLWLELVYEKMGGDKAFEGKAVPETTAPKGK
jgi:hypothetical protein